MIKFDNVSKIYPPNHLRPQETVALKDVSLEIKKGEFVVIAGRSGAGKTTIVRLIISEIKPEKGKIFFDDFEVNTVKSKDLSAMRQKIGVVFQDYKLLSQKTVFENVAYALEVLGIDEGRIKEEVPKVLKIVGLENHANHFPSELSGGEQQRVAIARAIVHRPKLLIADEPTGNLDPYNIWDIVKLLQKINEFGTTVILATHNQDIINNLEKRVISLEKGQIVGDHKKGKYII
ncbi:MAG: cell division ATP-binding protein FtsE [bacterium]|nr:cell division ATP-binding protein FtsE [bacterium]